MKEDYEKIATRTMINALEGVKAQIRKAYDKGYKDGQKEKLANAMIYDHEEAERKAYNRGLDDAWDIAKKIMRMDIVEKDAVFAEFGRATSSVILDLSASEVTQKIKAYEDKQKQDAEIKVGDEVIGEFGNKGIVITNVPSPLGDVSVWFSNQTHVQLYPVKNLSKTGRHFDQIAEVLKEIRGAENDE